MPNHDIIVIGASAGGVEALQIIANNLPAAFPAALFVVTHMPPDMPSALPNILTRGGPLPAVHVPTRMPIEPGHIYCARPDHHLLVQTDHIHSVRGIKANGLRPAIDATFRS